MSSLFRSMSHHVSDGEADDSLALFLLFFRSTDIFVDHVVGGYSINLAFIFFLDTVDFIIVKKFCFDFLAEIHFCIFLDLPLIHIDII